MSAHSKRLVCRPLATCLAAALALGGCDLAGAAPAVTNCADSGNGSLRAAVAGAVDNDTIDLTQLTCGTITLTTSRIDTTNTLTIVGAGPAALTIDGNHQDRVFNHAGAATLTLEGLSIVDGSNDLVGGCIYAQGALVLRNTTLSGCHLRNISGTGFYKGGGAFVQGDLSVFDSTISGNEVSSDLGQAIGGGLYATHDLLIVASTISGNRASSASDRAIVSGGGAYSFGNMTVLGSVVSGNAAEAIGVHSGVDGGGLYALGNLVATYSTISDNHATAPQFAGGGGATVLGNAYFVATTVSGNQSGRGGGLELLGFGSAPQSTLVNTTISGNESTDARGGGGLYSATPLTLQNCTVAVNTSQAAGRGGLMADDYAVDLQGTIIAGNIAASLPGDVDVRNGAVVTGSHNLIVASTTPVPTGTIQADPRLGPLASNGGVTRTQALRADSPAIDHGNNVHGAASDQRGTGFARVVGTEADIGAFEFDPDRIFANGFD